MVSSIWSGIKKFFIAVGLFIGGFFLIKRGIDLKQDSDVKGKAAEDAAKSKAEVDRLKQRKKIDSEADNKKKKAAEDLKKKSKISKIKPKKKEKNFKNSQPKTQKPSRKYSKKNTG